MACELREGIRRSYCGDGRRRRTFWRRLRGKDVPHSRRTGSVDREVGRVSAFLYFVGFAEEVLVENVQRADLNALEEALAYQQLVDEFGLSQAEVARRVGLSRASIWKYMKKWDIPLQNPA